MAGVAKSTKARKSSGFVKYYLVSYNVLSTIGWAYILTLTLLHILNVNSATSSKSASSVLARFLSTSSLFRSTGFASTSTTIESHLPYFLQPLYNRSTTTFAHVGISTAIVQSFAVLEVLHVIVGWVRSPLQTTIMQVSSRLFLVWGVVEQFDIVHTNPLYTSMVIAWSMTEVIRYSFYACNLLGYEPGFLVYLRYTTFYILYPLGASSEAFLIYATLPSTSPIPSLQSWVHGMWKPTDYARAILFIIWWPGLYMMYTYMISQRRKVLGSGSSYNVTKSKGLKVN